MKIAVTGASGFVGSHVLRQLLKGNNDIVAATRNPDRIMAAASNLSVVELDISKPKDAYARLCKPDVLVHLAWGGLPNYRSDAHLLEELPRQIAFLDECSEGGLKKLVVSGTCLEYGMREGCLDETMKPVPTIAYAQAKDQLRSHLEAISARGGPGLTWLRLFYLFGPGQSPNSLYSMLRAAITARGTSFAMSPGDQERDFLPIESAAEIICSLAMLPVHSGVVNVCSGLPMRIVDVVQLWLQRLNSRIALHTGVYPYPDYEAHSFWGSTGKLDALLPKMTRNII